MTFKTGLAIAAVTLGLCASSVAMSHDDHDRKGYEKGKKTGWHDGALPPGQAKKESKEWRREHKHDSDWHRHEAKEREREAREHRYRATHPPVITHTQPKPPVNKQREMTVREKAAAVERARKEHRAEAQINH